MEEFPRLVFWHWWSLALLLLILEVLVPGAVFLWIAIAAGAVGLIILIFPDTPLAIQLLVLGILSIASIFVWMRLEKHRRADKGPPLNRRAYQYVGRTFALDEPIINGFGKIRVDDSIWKISGDDLPTGSRVRVVDADGAVLKVERADQGYSQSGK